MESQFAKTTNPQVTKMYGTTMFMSFQGTHMTTTTTSRDPLCLLLSALGMQRSFARRWQDVPPNPSIKRTVKGLRPSPAAYVKR